MTIGRGSIVINELLARYDDQLRKRATAPPPARIEHDGRVVRYVSDEVGWDAVIWADIDAATADGEIARQLEYFAGRGRRFEWKYHEHDRPADLANRLRAAGLVPEDDEALMVAEAASLAADETMPPGVRLVPVTDEAGIDLVVQVHEEVFAVEHAWLRPELLARLAEGGRSGQAVLAMADDRPVCAARVEYHAGTDFASLWGGGTLPEWRGKGIYRGLVAYRARLARDRGYRYLQVDASSDSRPILERLGFLRLTTTTPYIWEPS